LIWPVHFEQRLAAWCHLRDDAKRLPIEDALAAINSWWHFAPWRAYHLHWDDRLNWPDPWQLLSDNIYCDVAKGLGIMYTITLLDREDMQHTRMVESCQGNLVLVDKEKYILNWGPDIGVNNNLEQKNFPHQVTQSDLKKQLD
jgi:hypothetical protein